MPYSQVLCEDLSIHLTDILHKLHTEAFNLLHMEIYARNMPRLHSYRDHERATVYHGL